MSTYANVRGDARLFSHPSRLWILAMLRRKSTDANCDNLEERRVVTGHEIGAVRNALKLLNDLRFKK